MPRYIQDQIDERIQKLPEALRDALYSPSLAEKIFDLGVKYGLNIEQTGFLGEETGNIILGFTKPEDFAKVLQETLQIQEDNAKKIAGEINQAILVPLRDLLKSAHGIEIKGGDEVTPKGTPVFMQKPSSPPEVRPEWIIKPELKQSSSVPSGPPPKVVLPEKEIQIPLPTSRPNFAEQNLGGSVKPAQPVIDLKNTAPPKLPESIPPSKVPPIDLRAQARPAVSVEPAPSVEPPISPPPPPFRPADPPVASKTEPPTKAMPDKGTDPYREQID